MSVSQHYKTGAKNMKEWWEVFTVIALLQDQQMYLREMHWLSNNKTITVSCWWLGVEVPLNNRFLVHTTYWWWLLPKPGNLMESHPETQINDFHWLDIKRCWAVPEGPKTWRSWSWDSPGHFQRSALCQIKASMSRMTWHLTRAVKPQRPVWAENRFQRALCKLCNPPEVGLEAASHDIWGPRLSLLYLPLSVGN